MTSVLTWVVLCAATVVVVILVAPIRVRGSFAGMKGTFRLSWLGWSADYHGDWLIVTFLGVRLRKVSLKESKKAKPKKKERKREKKPSKLTLSKLLDNLSKSWELRPVLRRVLLVVLRLLGRLLRSWHLVEGRVNMTVGTGDPAHTGMLIGYFHAARGVLARRWRRLHWQLNPDFNRSRFEMNGYLTLRLIPIEPMIHVVRALASLPWRGLWRLKRAWAA